MDYDNLKECSNCGKYTTSLSASNRCHSCQQVEDYVPDFHLAYCYDCDLRVLPFFEGDVYICPNCGKEVDY